MYTIAALSSWTEFWLESYYFPSYKSTTYGVMVTGAVFIICGQAARSFAMITCGEHFSHIIMNRRNHDHQLVTTGIYS
eukprot:gene17603-36141_t